MSAAPAIGDECGVCSIHLVVAGRHDLEQRQPQDAVDNHNTALPTAGMDDQPGFNNRDGADQRLFRTVNGLAENGRSGSAKTIATIADVSTAIIMASRVRPI